MLHAWRLKLVHPRTGEAMSFVAPPPEDFQSFLAAHR
jgi:23S rRNA-/tRNA-specific pseudouridylate synthase